MATKTYQFVSDWNETYDGQRFVIGAGARYRVADAGLQALIEAAEGSAGEKVAYDVGADFATDADLAALQAQMPLRGHIVGLTLANNTSDVTNDIDIAAGEAASDGTTPVLMQLAAALTKRLDAAWAVGSGNGGLDTGSTANTTYHVFLIRNSSSGVVDALFSTSATAPTMPSGYDQKRRIGSIIRASGAILEFRQYGDRFRYLNRIADVSATDPGTSAVTRTLTVPIGIEVMADIAVVLSTGSASAVIALITALDETDRAVSGTNYNFATAPSGGLTAVPALIKTNTSGQVRSRLNASGSGQALLIQTYGWIDRRGRDS